MPQRPALESKEAALARLTAQKWNRAEKDASKHLSYVDVFRSMQRLPHSTDLIIQGFEAIVTHGKNRTDQ